MSRRLIAIFIVAIALAACGGGSKKGSTTTPPPADVPSLTFNGTTSVKAGETGEVTIPSNTDFTIEGPEGIAWDYENVWFQASGLVGGSSFSGRFVAEKEERYVIKGTFSNGSTATLIVTIAAGGQCDDKVTCSGHGACVINDAGFPVCGCDSPYYSHGFDCKFAGSCMLSEDYGQCVDYSGSYWGITDGGVTMAEENCTKIGEATYSATPCSPPASETLTGTCTGAGDLADPTTQFLVSYYSWNATEAGAACVKDWKNGSWSDE